MNTDLSSRRVPRALSVSIIAVICAILCGGYYFYRYQKVNLTEAKRNELSAIADLKRSQIVDWRNERMKDGVIIQNNPLINYTIQSFLQSPADVRTKNDILMWLNVRKSTYRYLSAMLCDTSGKILLSTEQNDSISLNTQCAVHDAVLSRSILFTDLHQIAGSTVIHLDIIIPVFDLRKSKKNVTAVVLLRVDPETYLYPLLKSWPIPGNSFESFIFRRDGDSVLYLSELRHKKNTALRFRLAVTEEHLPAAVAVRTGERYYEGIDYRGISVVSVTRMIPGTSWYLIVKMDADELFAPLQRELQIAIFFSLLLIISFVSTVGFILRSQRAEYYRSQYHFELQRKQVEESLRQSEQFLKETQKIAGLGSYVLNLSTGRWTSSSMLDDIFGIDETYPRTVEGWASLLHPEWRETMTNYLTNDVVGRRGRFDKEYKIIRKNDGAERWVHGLGKLDFDENNQPTAMIGTISDITGRKIAENALELSEKKYRTLHESMIDGFVSVGMDGRLIEFNEVYRTMLGYSEAELMQLSYIDITPQQWHEYETGIVEHQVLKRGYSDLYQKEYRRKDGTIVPVELHTVLIRDDLGNPQFMWAIVRDITEHKRSEEKMKESHALLKIAERKAKLGGWSVNLEDNLCYWSEEVAAIHEMPFGFVPRLEEGINFYAPEWREKITRVFTDCAEKGISYDEEMEIITPTGKKVWVQTIGEAVRNDKGKIIKVHGAFQDISIRKKEEESLQLHSLRLKNMIQIDKSILLALESPEEIVYAAIKQMRSLLQCQRVSVGIFNLEKKEMMIYAAVVENEMVVQTGKVLPESIYGDIDLLRKNKMEIIEDESKVPSPSSVNMMLQAEGLQSFINVALVSELEMYGVMNIGWVEPKIITVNERDIAGEVASQITIAIEKARLLKETKRYAAELEARVIQRTVQLEEANKELEAFSYSVSHDLRAPLRHVGGYVNLLSKYFPDALPEQGKHYLSSITDSVQQMGTLIDDLLQFSRTSRSEMKMVKVDMREMVADIVQSYHQECPKRSIEWTIGPLPAIVCDSPMMKLVWTNLLSNAVKFTKPRENARIEIGIADNTAEYIFSVRDNGVGFDMRYADKLFGVFQRLHSKSEFEGTGIGLANVHRIVLRHGGRIWAEAELNNGATFSFTLPKRKD
jgi:PAS domain S-box-containing protein